MRKQEKRSLEFFAICTPGLEELLIQELNSLSIRDVKKQTGGVTFYGDKSTLYLANLSLRTATRILYRLGTFPVTHLAQLHKRASRVDWINFFSAEQKIHVKATCHKSKIYHSKAAAERVAKAIGQNSNAQITDKADPDAQDVLIRINHNQCTLSIDSSGEPLYRRGFKQETCPAPLRESLAAAALLISGYDGSQPLVDPMCGSGTFALEAIMIATGQAPGARREFAFMNWAEFDKTEWQKILDTSQEQKPISSIGRISISDRDPGAIEISKRNLERAGFSDLVQVRKKSLSEIEPTGESGLLVCNPPYGDRLGKSKALSNLYSKLGQIFIERFKGWKLCLITSQPKLALNTGLDFSKVSSKISHGGLKIQIYQASNPH
jgi:putative N6-adenine-specific DNA methylase